MKVAISVKINQTRRLESIPVKHSWYKVISDSLHLVAADSLLIHRLGLSKDRAHGVNTFGEEEEEEEGNRRRGGRRIRVQHRNKWKIK